MVDKNEKHEKIVTESDTEVKKSWKCSENRHLNIYNFTTTGQTSSAELDHVIQLKVPEQLLKGPRGETVLSASVSIVKNELSISGNKLFLQVRCCAQQRYVGM